MQFNITTPQALHDELLKFAGKLVAGGRPQFVSISAADWAAPKQCFFNVVGEKAGSASKPIFGWLIWEYAGAWLEAERHAIIENEEGLWVDITPQTDGESRIVFLKDPDWAFDYHNPKPAFPERWPLSDSIEVRKLLDEMSAFDKFRWRHSNFVGDQVQFSYPNFDEKLRRQYHRLEARVSGAQKEFFRKIAE